MGRSDGESVCVAGVRLDAPSPEWVRLWPVGFRELPEKFSKWQEIELLATKSSRDLRPASFTPNLDSLKLGAKIDSSKNWQKRRALLGHLIGETTLCDLMAAQGENYPGPSLGLVKVAPGATARIIDGPEWKEEKLRLANHAAGPNLFRQTALQPMRPPRYQVSYDWNCLHAICPGHNHTSCDWEVGAAALNLSRKYSDVRIPMLENFGPKMLPPLKDTYFFVGNQHQYPRSFMVLGAFYPSVE